jgi:hypothetical protein
MNMVLILNNLLIDIVGVHALSSMSPPQRLYIGILKLSAEIVHDATDVLAKELHASEV